MYQIKDEDAVLYENADFNVFVEAWIEIKMYLRSIRDDRILTLVKE